MGLSQTTSSQGHEQRDISFGAVVTFALALAAALVVVHFVVGSVYRHLASRPSVHLMSSSMNTSAVRTGPGLLVNQSADMEKLRASEEAALNTYGWVDREHGIVRIPIDRAIDLLVETNRGAQP